MHLSPQNLDGDAAGSQQFLPSLTGRYRLPVFHSRGTTAHRIPRTPSPSLLMHFGQWQDITEMKGWVLITCSSIVMHWAWAEAGCGYGHMYVWKGTQRNVGAPIFPHHRIAENPLAFQQQKKLQPI